MLKKIYFTIIDMLFPSRCAICRRLISYQDNCLCDDCYKKIEFVSDGCPVCSGTITDKACNICSNRAWYIEKNITIAEYRGIMKEIIHKFKFNKVKRLYNHLSKLACNEIEKYAGEIDLVTSVPMTRKKKWERGFDQSGIIARNMAGKLNMVFENVLKEIPGSSTQRELHYIGRFFNNIGRYTVKRPDCLIGKTVMVIDDVLTTGSTINECARILLESGAIRVYSLTLARANVENMNDEH